MPTPFCEAFGVGILAAVRNHAVQEFMQEYALANEVRCLAVRASIETQRVFDKTLQMHDKRSLFGAKVVHRYLFVLVQQMRYTYLALFGCDSVVGTDKVADECALKHLAEEFVHDSRAAARIDVITGQRRVFGNALLVL